MLLLQIQAKILYILDFQGDMSYLLLGSNGYKSDNDIFLVSMAGFQLLLVKDSSSEMKRHLATVFENEDYCW